MSFDRESAPGCVLRITSGLEGGFVGEDFPKSRDFLIIPCTESILLLCLVWIVAIAMATADVNALVMDYWK